MRDARIRLLNAELDSIRQSAVERTRSIDSKSSFAVVAAGVLAGATFTGLVTADTYFIGLIPFALTVASVIAAIIALWPTRVWAPSGRLVVTEWVDKHGLTPEVLADNLLEVKAREVEKRDEYNERRSKATKAGLVLLGLSLIASLIVVGVNTAVNEGVIDVGRNTPTPSTSVAP
jgi:hypothetical protein